MPYNIRMVSTYPPRRCGIGTFSRDLATALEHFTSEVGNIRVAAIDHGTGRYDIPVDLIIDQYNPVSWRDTTTHIITRAKESSNPTVVLLQHEYGLDPDDKIKERYEEIWHQDFADNARIDWSQFTFEHEEEVLA